MKYHDFEQIISAARLNRYEASCSGNGQKAMVLYRRNLELSQELFTTISCFEVAIRNAIDRHMLAMLGNDWLKNGIAVGGIFDNAKCRTTKESIRESINKLSHTYTHNKLVAELGFGFWRYMFAPHQFAATGRTLLHIFPAKPTSTVTAQYNQTYVFNQLAQINNLRNRIAHHEPICFLPGTNIKTTAYARQQHQLILQLLSWMGIDSAKFLFGIDHVISVCSKVDAL